MTSYFKLLTKDEMEVNELLEIQLSRNSRTASFESAKTLSTLSSAVMSSIDLTDLSYEFQPPKNSKSSKSKPSAGQSAYIMTKNGIRNLISC